VERSEYPLHEKADFWASFEKVRLQEVHALSQLIGRIGPIFNQKDDFLDFILEFMYGFLDLQCFYKRQGLVNI
jgi:hypothetical protein